jgi:hypothetical protein
MVFTPYCEVYFPFKAKLLNSQIGLFYLFIDQQVVGRVGKGNPTILHDVSPMGNLQGKVGVLFHEKNGSVVFVVNFLYDLKYLLYD